MKNLINCQFQDLGDEWWCVKLPKQSSKAGQYIVGISVARGEWQAYAALTSDKTAIDEYEIDPMASAEELAEVGATKLKGVVDRGYGNMMCFEVVPDKEYFIQNLEKDHWFCGLFLGTEDEVYAYMRGEKTSDRNEDEPKFSRRGRVLLKVPENISGTFVVPNSVTHIKEGAFARCRGLTSVTIPDSVISIGPIAFLGCDSLTSITIPTSVTSIEDGTFFGCDQLTSITIPDSVTSINANAFQKCDNLKNIRCSEEIWKQFRRCFPEDAYREDVDVRRIDESTKITLTLGQLKRLVKEV